MEKDSKVEHTKKDSILTRFKNKLGDKPLTKEIIDFLSFENAYFLTLDYRNLDELSYELCEEYARFYNYFKNHYEKSTRHARQETWDGEALVLKVGAGCVDKLEVFYMEDFLSRIDKFILKEAQELFDIIFPIRKRKDILVINKGSYQEMNVPAVLPQHELNDYKIRLMYMIVTMITEGSTIYVRCDVEKNKSKIFGACSVERLSWSPLTKDFIMEENRIAPIFQNLPKNHKYTFEEINKNKNSPQEYVDKYLKDNNLKDIDELNDKTTYSKRKLLN